MVLEKFLTGVPKYRVGGGGGIKAMSNYVPGGADVLGQIGSGQEGARGWQGPGDRQKL